MKKKLLNNFGLKLISLVIAIMVWLIIVNINDAYDTKSITLAVQEINAEDLEGIGKTYEVVSGSVATAKIRARASVLKDLDEDDFRATADLSKLSDTGAVWVDITAKDYVSSEVEIIPDNNVYKVVTENLIEKQFSVVIKTTGEVANGYYLGEAKATPVLVNIKGSETKISNIKEVAVTLDVENCSSNISREGIELVVYALNGDPMDTSRLTISHETVDVAITMLRTKTVPVKLTFKGEPADGYTIVSKESAEDKVLVAGTKEDLDNISVLEMECDLTGATESIEQTILYRDFLPENIHLAEGDADTSGVAVNVVIDPITSRTIDIPFDDVELEGASESYEYILNGDIDTVAVTITGAKSLVDAVKPKDLNVSVDVSSYSAGVYTILLNVETDSPVTVKDYQHTTIQIKK